ncbi:MAG: glucose-6-phosphate isomerase [Erysipelotrichaceae bacterium]|nr:glucose-6-phosphate isomerase [Erysipelotrichaceae bacterium]
MIRVNLSRVDNSSKNLMKSMKNKVVEIDKMINEKTGEGSDFLGWLDYAKNLKSSEIKRINKTAERIQKNCDVLVVIGIGGSYLGSKAVIDAINGIVNQSPCKVVYMGQTLSPTYTFQMLEYLKDKKIAINVISKSGTTLEPSIAFRLVSELAKKCWGPKKYAKYVVATTDAKKGALHQMAFAEGFEEYVIPDDVGGRYSVFTPVGLIPMAVAGVDISSFIAGVVEGSNEYSSPVLDENEAYKYAVLRYVEKVKNKISVEFLITYEPHFVALAEWWKQLFGESEGKNKKGLLPASLCFTTDLHSMGQFCQEGTPCFFETTIAVGKYQNDVTIPKTLVNLDKLNYLAGKSLSQVEDVAISSTLDAHFVDGKHDNALIEISEMNPFTLGKLMFFFCKACAMSAYLLEINPFNQPGVEIYKARMKDLLKKL